MYRDAQNLSLTEIGFQKIAFYVSVRPQFPSNYLKNTI